MNSLLPKFEITLPNWLIDFYMENQQSLPDMQDRMRFAIRLSELNIKHRTGGPFGAAVFDMNTNKPVAPGVNLVVPNNSSVLHAEIVAMIFAQQVVGQFILRGANDTDYELVSSTEPCAMCMGAVPWAGIKRLVCGARDKDARRIGFDEGAKLKHWVKALNQRNIQVVKDICRKEAVSVLNQYKNENGFIYNG